MIIVRSLPRRDYEKKSHVSSDGYCSSGAGVIAEAQQPAKIPRIGYLSQGFGPGANEEIFRQGLRSFGYIEGQTIAIEWRFAHEKLDRLPELAAELVRLKVAIIVAGTGRANVQAAKSATTDIPIVMANVNDPVALGFVASLARPGGNITGLSNLSPEIGGKRLELLKEAFPKHLAWLFSEESLPISKRWRPQLGHWACNLKSLS